MSINPYPEICNICGGKVIYTSNARVYHGKVYGSGKCYLCLDCGAYVGTHKPHMRQALGLLADESMRKAKIKCHDIFDSKWKGKEFARNKREAMYYWLAKQLDISVSDCHFGYFDMATLNRAYPILLKIKDKELDIDHKGRIVTELDA